MVAPLCCQKQKHKKKKRRRSVSVPPLMQQVPLPHSTGKLTSSWLGPITLCKSQLSTKTDLNYRLVTHSSKQLGRITEATRSGLLVSVYSQPTSRLFELLLDHIHYIVRRTYLYAYQLMEPQLSHAHTTYMSVLPLPRSCPAA